MVRMTRPAQTIQGMAGLADATLAHVERRADHLLVCCSDGNFLDAELVQHLYVLLHRLLESGVDRVVLDLSEVQQADTKLVGCLLVLLCRARSVNVRLEVRCSRIVKKWLAICHLQPPSWASTRPVTVDSAQLQATGTCLLGGGRRYTRARWARQGSRAKVKLEMSVADRREIHYGQLDASPILRRSQATVRAGIAANRRK